MQTPMKMEFQDFASSTAVQAGQDRPVAESPRCPARNEAARDAAFLAD
jgi:hypothetical protein